jgi:hypothetical protein
MNAVILNRRLPGAALIHLAEEITLRTTGD